MLDDFLDTIHKKLKRLCYELLITLDCDPPDIVALRELYLRVLTVEDELVGCFGGTVPLGVKEVFANFYKVFEQVLSSLAKMMENNESPARIIVNPIHACLCAFSQMMVLLMSSSNEPLVQSHEPLKTEQPEGANSEEKKELKGIEEDSKEEFACLIDLLGELMMSKSVFQNLSRQALLEYNLPSFSKEIKANGKRVVRVMERLEETVMGLCCRYTNLIFRKRKVLPFEAGEQAFFVEVNQVLEVLKVSQKEMFKRRGRFFYHYRGETLGLVFLSDFFGRTSSKKPDPRGIIVITDGTTKLGLGVEHWSIEQEVLVKPLLDIFVGQREIAGAAVMEDGQISLMLDGVTLIKRVSLEQEQED